MLVTFQITDQFSFRERRSTERIIASKIYISAIIYYVFKSLRESNGYGATRLCVLRKKRWNADGPKTMIKNIDNGTINRLPGSERRTNMHRSRRSYLIILLIEGICWWSLSLPMWVCGVPCWLNTRLPTSSMLAGANVFSGKSHYIFIFFILHIAKQIYMMPELCHRYKRFYYIPFDNFYIAKIWIYSATFSDFFVRICSFFQETPSANVFEKKRTTVRRKAKGLLQSLGISKSGELKQTAEISWLILPQLADLIISVSVWLFVCLFVSSTLSLPCFSWNKDIYSRSTAAYVCMSNLSISSSTIEVFSVA